MQIIRICLNLLIFCAIMIAEFQFQLSWHYSNMFQDRQLKIIEYLNTHNLATVDELVAYTNASAATIRRDLIKLDSIGEVYRLHGSVSLRKNAVRQPTTSEKLTQHHEAKMRIAAAASKLIRENDSLVLDAGTTTIELARNLLDRQVKIITTDLNIGLLLCGHDNLSVSLTGGNLDSSSQSCTGDLARQMLERIHPKFSFVSCNAWDLEQGITAPTAEKAHLKSDIMQAAAQVVLLADSSKYGKVQLFEVSSLQQVDEIITDKDLPREIARKIQEAGISLTLV